MKNKKINNNNIGKISGSNSKFSNCSGKHTGGIFIGDNILPINVQNNIFSNNSRTSRTENGSSYIFFISKTLLDQSGGIEQVCKGYRYELDTGNLNTNAMTQQALHFYSFKELLLLYSPEIQCLPELKEKFSKLVGEQKFVSDTNQPPLLAADKAFAVDPSSLSVSTRQNYSGPEKPRQPPQKPPNIFANTPHAAQMVSGKAMGEEEYKDFEQRLMEQAPEDLWDMPVQGEQEEDPNGTSIIDTEKFKSMQEQIEKEKKDEYDREEKYQERINRNKDKEINN
ncbi:MAG: hypothetical protein EZS28_035938, partial [Streblomastix strix]